MWTNASFLLIFKHFLLVLLQFIWYNELLKIIIRNYMLFYVVLKKGVQKWICLMKKKRKI